MAARNRAEKDPGNTQSNTFELELRAQENSDSNGKGKHKNRMCYTRAKE
jgi:hypothetical protein